ncbi:MAG: hypothetical protein U0670_23390 [Anaerolineae bacterium]
MRRRGLLKDEVSGLFGAINKRDYMVGMKDLLMELYDCPDYFDKDTQTGLNVVENAALSILGVTTPASLGSAISVGIGTTACSSASRCSCRNRTMPSGPPH